MPKNNQLLNSNKSPKVMSDILSGSPNGKALELIAQYAPQTFMQILQEDQKIVKLDNLARSLHLNTTELYSFNAAIEEVGGDWNEVANLYQTVQKLNDHDPKNKERLDKLIKYTGILTPIDKTGFIDPNFLTRLSASETLPGLNPTDKTELYEILGINRDSGLEYLLSQGKGKLTDSANFFKPIAPNKVQIENARESVSLFSKGKALLHNQAHLSEENDNLSIFKSTIKNTEDYLFQHIDAINQGEKTFTQDPIAKLADPKIRKTISGQLNDALIRMAISSDPFNPVPIMPLGKEISPNEETPHGEEPPPLLPEFFQQMRSQPLTPSAPLQNFAKEVAQARKSALTNRYHQNQYFSTLAKNQQQGFGTRPLSLSFGNINVTTQEDDDPFAFAEAVKSVVSEELMKVLVSFGPYR
ncbi:hypothetical protein FAI41_04490 [Acetobacteraceae bacterium]|nr:hypothetical protein FAI41_04490 [Acetobacteraceae bacterium]